MFNTRFTMSLHIVTVQVLGTVEFDLCRSLKKKNWGFSDMFCMAVEGWSSSVLCTVQVYME